MSFSKTTVKIEKKICQSLKHVARKDQTYSQIVQERIKCDSAGCDSVGIYEIKAHTVKFGIVTLFVCSECIGKFHND